jgi:CBS domain-containing protein
MGPRAGRHLGARLDREVVAIADARPFVLKPDATVGDVVDQVRENGFGVVLGDDGEVLGTVDDGAVRRAALKHASLDLPVMTVMSGRPLVADAGDSEERVVELLRSYRVRAVPVVKNGRLVEVRTLDEAPEAGPGKPIAVVMVGGRGERLRPLTDKLPKPLLRIGGSSIVERLISALASAGVEDVYLAVNYKADEFDQRLGSGESLGVRLQYMREKEPLHTAGALSMLPVTPTSPACSTTTGTTAGPSRSPASSTRRRSPTACCGRWSTTCSRSTRSPSGATSSPRASTPCSPRCCASSRPTPAWACPT